VSTETETPFTIDELLLMKKDDILNKVRATTPQITGEFFTPDAVEPDKNPTLLLIKEHDAAFTRYHARLVKTLAWAIPAFIFIPAGLALVFDLGPEAPAFIFVACIILSIIYFWFTGRVNRWKKKTLETHVVTAEKESERLLHTRASQWARNRYTLPKGQVEWSAYGSEFRLGRDDSPTVLVWEEPEDGKYRLKDVRTGEEPPLA
jgi:hypothetical protein